MAGPGSQWTGPLSSGPIWNPGDLRGPVNTGLAELVQTGTLAVNGTNAVTFQFNVPSGSQITGFNIDTTVAWNSGTSDSLTIGLTAGGTDFVSAVSVAAAGRASQGPIGSTVPYTAAQLAAQLVVGSTPSNGVPVFATVTPVGTAATTGSTTVTMNYVQTVQLLAGDA
jgi:hypothetical protein